MFNSCQEWEACGCGRSPNCTASSGIIETGEVLLLSLARQMITRDITKPPALQLSISKSTCAVFPDPYLFGGRQHLRLKAIIEHLGLGVHSGHYIAHIRQDDGTYLTYDDERVRAANYLEDSTFRNSRLYVYEAYTPTEGQSDHTAKIDGAASSTAKQDAHHHSYYGLLLLLLLPEGGSKTRGRGEYALRCKSERRAP